MMDTQQELSRIWDKYDCRLGREVQQVLNRKYVYACPGKKDILVTGINPSFREGDALDPFGYSYSATDRVAHPYFTEIDKRLGANSENADYLDVFYYREMEQAFIHTICKEGGSGFSFLAEQARLSQHIVEDMTPKLIIVKNKGSWFVWGKEAHAGQNGQLTNVWMGYAFECLDVPGIHCGEVCRITGLIDSPERISPEIRETKLNGAIVLFTKSSRFQKSEERLTPEQVEILYQLAKKK